VPKEHKEKDTLCTIDAINNRHQLTNTIGTKGNSTCCRRVHVRGNMSSDNISPRGGYHSNQCIGSSID